MTLGIIFHPGQNPHDAILIFRQQLYNSSTTQNVQFWHLPDRYDSRHQELQVWSGSTWSAQLTTIVQGQGKCQVIPIQCIPANYSCSATRIQCWLVLGLPGRCEGAAQQQAYNRNRNLTSSSQVDLNQDHMSWKVWTHGLAMSGWGLRRTAKEHIADQGKEKMFSFPCIPMKSVCWENVLAFCDFVCYRWMSWELWVLRLWGPQLLPGLILLNLMWE